VNVVRLQIPSVVAAVAVAAALSASAPAWAASGYQPQDNTAVNVNVGVPLPNLGTGALTFGLQQTLQSVVSGVTGVSLPYDYVAVNVDGQNLANVDPFCFYQG
jgi:hypothetical protein